MKKIVSLLLATVLLMASASAFVSCGEGNSTQNSEPIDYTVKLTDYKGEPLVTVAVAEFLDEGGSLIQQKRIGADGTALFSAMPGNYKVKIQFLDTKASFVYNETDAVLTADKTVAEIKVYSDTVGEKQTIYVPCIHHVSTDASGAYCSFCGNEISLNEEGRGAYEAKTVGEGATLVRIDRKELSYFIFTPTRGGIYKISAIVDGEYSFGNYGSPHFVLPYNVAEVENGSFEETIPNSSIGEGEGGTVQVVLGVSSETAENAVIVIERIGNYNPGVPFTEIEAAPTLENYVAESGNYVDIDLTSANVEIVYNDADGYYHYGSAMGPVVLVKVGVVTDESGVKNSSIPEFLFASYETICETDSMCKYFYDENGEVVKKERYNALIATYVEKAGTCTVSYSEGETVQYKVMPLDKALETAIKNTAEHRMWFDATIGIFGQYASSINMENAWLYACCYKAI